MTRTLAPHPARSRRSIPALIPRVSADRFEWFAVLVCGVALVELVILRLVTRTLIHIPGLERIAAPVQALGEAGRAVYHLGIVGVLIVLVAAALVLARRPGVTDRLAAAGIVAFLVAAATGAIFDVVVVSAFGTVMAVLFVAPAAIGRSDPRRAVLWLYVGAFSLAGTYALLQHAVTIGAGAVSATWTLVVAEVLALGFGLATPLLTATPTAPTTRSRSQGSTRRPDYRALAAAMIAGVAVLGAGIGAQATGRILLLWNFGLTGSFALPFYALAAAAIVYTTVALWRDGRHGDAAGLVLLITGGIALVNTYQSALVLAGLSAFAVAAQRDRVRAESSAESLAESLNERGATCETNTTATA